MVKASCDSPPPVAQEEAKPTYSPLFVPWLAAPTVCKAEPITEQEKQTLTLLQTLLEQPCVPDNLLPRAAELVPQLIALLRETQLPLNAIAQRVSKDPFLTAEVLRLASSPFYRIHGDVTDLTQGIWMIGTLGLQSAIARVVLKPIYRNAAGATSARHMRTMTRLWEHSEDLTEHMVALAAPGGFDRFDAYLLGMLHDTGWKVVLASLDHAKLELVAQPTADFVVELTELAHRLFGLAAQRWAITPGFSAVAVDARQNGLANGQHPMATLLRQALPLCAMHS